jgi:hypothetical protein
MQTDCLPRLKPDPLPAIHPIPEYAAKGDLKAVYEATKSGLSVPWMGVVTMAFAHYRSFYAQLWTALEPMVASQQFEEACLALRYCAEEQANGLTPSALTKPLSELDYSDPELDEIKACNEIFSEGNMPYLLIATLARLLLEGQDWKSDETLTPSMRSAISGARPILIEPHHACADLNALYADIRSTLGLPFVNTDYRAFARWPSYFKLAWSDLQPSIQTDAYEQAVTCVHDKACELARSLANPTGLTSEQLLAAASKDADPSEILDVVRLFQWLLPSLAVNVAYFRGQLIRS